MEIEKESKMALAGGQMLADEIEAVIRDVVISNAAGIERFHERREELTKIDHEFLFFYAVSLVLVFASGAEQRTEEELDGVIQKVAEETIRAMRFRTADPGDPESERRAVAARLRAMFKHVRTSFGRLEEIGEGKERDDVIFTLMLMYLRRIYPACVALLAEKHHELPAKLLQSFGLVSMSAHRY